MTPGSKSVESSRVAVACGAAGIGRASARTLAREGAAVLVADIAAARGEAVAAEIRAAGGRAEFRVCDVTRAEEVEAAVAACETAFGGLDVLIANAAFPV